MKILWISNTIFPEACTEINIKSGVVGGWMQSGANALLSQNEDLSLAVASLYSGNDLKIIDKYKIKYYLIPKGKDDNTYDKIKESNYKKIILDFQPQLIHIHGSEYPHSLAACIAADKIPVVLSVQGLSSQYCNFYYAGINESIIKKMSTIKDFIRHNSLIHQKLDMENRGSYEKDLISRVNHVIGRTSWDKSCVWGINPKSKYHFCNETLRSGFYKFQWSYQSCEKHSIFLSQAHYPIKGGHQIIKALPIILNEFPDTQVYIAGHNFLDQRFLHRSGFGMYFKKLMDDCGVADHVHILGVLEEEKMIEQYLKANVFVCPSSIENSPNSVGESQLLGTPVIASYVGGTMDMVTDGVTGFLYRFEETSLLAMRVCELFRSQELCERISNNEREIAMKRHDRETNAKQTLLIYNDILNQ